jgi:hypothetical protein
MASRYSIAATLVLVTVAGSARADLDPKLQEAVKRAIRGGQEFLLQARFGGNENAVMGESGPMSMGAGPACLAGLALIESGVPHTNKSLTALVQRCRQVALGSYNTYELSLLIMFFDRYGAKEDEPFIQFLTLRLMGGQTFEGAWTYISASLRLDPVQERSLQSEFTRGAKLTTPESDQSDKPAKKEPRPRTDIPLDPPAPKKQAPPPPKKEKEEDKPAGGEGLHPSVRPFLKYARIPGSGPAIDPLIPGNSGGDHSNTQFATVALWCGRRHHVDVSGALARLDKHYRQCQQHDGGWSYTADGGSSPAMTCAGLMGLAMGFGGKIRTGPDKPVKLDEEAIAKDRSISAGLNHLGEYLRAAAAEQPQPGRRFAQNDLSGNLYFMWSLERVGMVYGLNTIGKVDWYDWGCQLLVESQNPRDGSWPGHIHSSSPEVATAFALLFLSRANLAEDLTTSMQGKVKDPGQASLKSPGDLRSMLEKGSKGSPPPKAAPKSPPATADTADQMAAALATAKGAERDELIRRYRDAKGEKYLEALVLAAGQLIGEPQTQVRDALVQRLTRMTAGTINTMMKDRDRELRRAAALAAAAKGKDRLAEFAVALIERTADDDAVVVQAARAALKVLTDKDFGPELGASPADRKRARDAWQEWWQARK